jgi:hypothetical protein
MIKENSFQNLVILGNKIVAKWRLKYMYLSWGIW